MYSVWTRSGLSRRPREEDCGHPPENTSPRPPRTHVSSGPLAGPVLTAVGCERGVMRAPLGSSLCSSGPRAGPLDRAGRNAPLPRCALHGGQTAHQAQRGLTASWTAQSRGLVRRLALCDGRRDLGGRADLLGLRCGREKELDSPELRAPRRVQEFERADSVKALGGTCWRNRRRNSGAGNVIARRGEAAQWRESIRALTRQARLQGARFDTETHAVQARAR